MLSSSINSALRGSSVIRAMFNEGREMAAKFGAENVYDFSLGNPVTPAPEKIGTEIKRVIDSYDSLTIHGYMANAGYIEVRDKIADNLNRRFDTKFSGKNIVMSVGAAGGMNAIMKSIIDPDDEILVIKPYFGEYRGYVTNFGGKIVECESFKDSFQPDLADIESKINKRTKGIIINTPNNPTGVIYTDETLKALSALLLKKEKELGTDIYLISDEPYRELVYDGVKENFLTGFYHNTFVVYSFSKSLSLPGERIGYVVIPDEMESAGEVQGGVEIAIRMLGYVNAPSLMQRVVAECVDEKTDVAFYDENRKMLLDALTEYGFSCVKPQGAFYLWVKSPVEDEEEFVNAAKKYHILFVKGSAFGCGGFVRIAYCVSHETIKNSLPGFKELASDFGLLK